MPGRRSPPTRPEGSPDQPDGATSAGYAAHLRGALAEERVAEALVADGWVVLARNWRGGGGELDIVALRAGRLRFVEVKERAPDDPVGLEAIHAQKRRHLKNAAEAFLAGWREPVEEACFLVVLAVPRDGEWALEWVDDAFDA